MYLGEEQWILLHNPEDAYKVTQSVLSPEGSPVFQLTKETGLLLIHSHIPDYQRKPKKCYKLKIIPLKINSTYSCEISKHVTLLYHKSIAIYTWVLIGKII